MRESSETPRRREVYAAGASLPAVAAIPSAGGRVALPGVMPFGDG